MKRITLNCCQGLGDIFWVYQKFSPYVDEIDINICKIAGSVVKIQTRAIDFLRLFPKIKNVEVIDVTDDHYNNHLAHNYFPIADILNAGHEGPFDYCCNGPLEKGTRIEDIDTGYTIEETVNLKMEEMELPYKAGEYLTVYVSGSSFDLVTYKYFKIWLLTEWVNLIKLIYAKYNLRLPILFIGANYDEKVLVELQSMLGDEFQSSIIIDAKPENVIYILKNSVMFIGYQSGLNIIADNLDVKQLMLYFPHIEPMLYTWCKKSNIKTLFHADIFTNNAKKVVENLTLEL